MRGAVTTESDLDVLARLLSARYSCRAYLPDQVPRAIIERWLATAQRAASWCNTQPWGVIVTSGAATERFREGLLKAFDEEPSAPDIPLPAEYRGVSLARRRECGGQLYQSVGIARGDQAGANRQLRENFRLFGAPHALVLTSERVLGTYGAVDVGLYLGTLMLAAPALGIACIAQGAVARYSPFLRRHFGIAEDRTIVCGVAFGYADTASPVNGFRTSRAALDQVCTWIEQ